MSLCKGQRMFIPWYPITMLGLESSSVILKRLMKIGLGGAQSAEEIRLMFSEKSEAARQAGLSLMFGCTMAGLVDQYRVLVAANEKRLSA